METVRTFTPLIIKYGLYGTTVFLSGFLCYYLNEKRNIEREELEMKTQQKIPDEELEKILKKLKSAIVYQMAMIYDKIHEYDPHEYDYETQVKESDNDNSTELSVTTENRLEKFQSFKKNFADLSRDPRKVGKELIDIELKVIKKFNISPEDYFNSLHIALQFNSKIKQEVEYLARFKSFFENDSLMPIDFGPVVEKKHLHIVSNIYYLTIRSVARYLKTTFYDKGIHFSKDEVNKLFFHYYSANLKIIRQKVYDYFGVLEIDGLVPKTLVRTYGFYKSPFCQKRKAFEKLNEEFDIIRENIAKGIYIEEMVNDELFPEAIKEPVDTIIDLGSFINSTDREEAEKADNAVFGLLNLLKNQEMAAEREKQSEISK